MIVNKPPGMLSVPGREVLTLMNVRPRSEEWRMAINSLIGNTNENAIENTKDNTDFLVGMKRSYDALGNNQEDQEIKRILKLLLEKIVTLTNYIKNQLIRIRISIIVSI